MPLTPNQTRDCLNSLGHKARKNLGQNFLVDGNIVRKSITQAELNNGDSVVEIGPGLGTLSEAILQTGANLYAVELDPTLHEHLSNSLCQSYPDQFSLIEADAVDRPTANLPTDVENFKIVANLPYAITSVWLEKVLAGPLPQKMVLMLQKEAADRLTAQAGSKHFGAITIFLSAAFTKAGTHKVSKNCFYPVPKVDSALLFLDILEKPVKFSGTSKSLIRNLFTQRRKQLGRLVQSFPIPIEWLEKLCDYGCSLTSRPDEVPVSAWIELNKHLTD